MNTDDEDIGAVDTQEEENYFVSLTDLMTGVVFIFVILLVTYAITFRAAQYDLQNERAVALKATEAAAAAEADAKSFRESAEMTKRELEQKLDENRAKAKQIDALAEALRRREELRKTALEEVASRLSAKGVKVSVDSSNGIIRLPEELLFDSAQAMLRPGGEKALNILAGELTTLLQRWCSPQQQFRFEAVFIEGHTDSIPIRTPRFQDNWELSTARAVNISRVLTQAQPDLLRFTSPSSMPVLGVSGYGENRPVADNSQEDGRRKNRRIDIRFLLAYPTDEQVSDATGGVSRR